VEYPECEKMSKVKEQSQIIGEFLDWLQNERGITLAEYGSGLNNQHLYPIYKTIEKILAEYFEIDLDKVEQERRAMLDVLRKKN